MTRNAHGDRLPQSELARSCYYCGMEATTRDHIPPQAARARFPGMYKCYVVPACRECNSALGDRAPVNLVERGEFARQWLAERYASELLMPDWSPEELSELGPSMRRHVYDPVEVPDDSEALAADRSRRALRMVGKARRSPKTLRGTRSQP